MKSSNLLQGMIQGMESMGAKYIKTDGFHLYFTIKIGSDIDDDVKLKRSKDAFWQSFALGLKIKRI